MRIAIVAGARPNFMKIAPILHAIRDVPEIQETLIHTGQHYDKNLSDIFFQQLDIKRPDIALGLGGGTHAEQSGKVMIAIEKVLAKARHRSEPFDRVVVVGDVNSTMAAAIASAKMHVPVAHIEAGLRSFDKRMPEEINRILTDSICDQLFVSEPEGIRNLENEGRKGEGVFLVGNVMIDTLLRLLPTARATNTLQGLGLVESEYGVVTLHRPSNVDDAETLESILKVLANVSERLPLVFPIHPRTIASINNFGLNAILDNAPGLRQLPPLGYLEFLALTSSAKVIVTDSGGLQEESTALGIPCLTMRENTERPITVVEGSSTLVGSDANLLSDKLAQVLAGKYDVGKCPELWDGNAAKRIVSQWTVAG